MDQDLLDKFFAGKCTPEQEARVRHWLDRPVENENDLLKKSWLGIRAHMQGPAVRTFTSWPNYFAAACVLLAVGFAIWRPDAQKYIIHNTSPHYEAFNAKGLQFRLPPKAAARIHMGAGANSADLRFCGNIRIQNNSEEDVKMKLNLACTNTVQPDQTTLFTVRKDKKYLVFQYHFKSDELVVVEEDRIFDLPLPLQQRALKILEI